MKAAVKTPRAKTFPLTLAFILSIGLTLVAYFIATHPCCSDKQRMFLIIGLAGVQALIQLFWFFNIAAEQKPRWNLITFLFMALVIVVVIGGSLWIMYNLNYNMSM